MLIVYVPPSELTRFGAGLSGSGDILVPRTVPPKKFGSPEIAQANMMKRESNAGW